MAELSTKRRNALPKSKFGLPGSEKYPMPDKSHAANAKARATQMVNAGKLSASSAAKIRAKANRILGESAGGKGKPSTGPRTPGSRGEENRSTPKRRPVDNSLQNFMKRT